MKTLALVMDIAGFMKEGVKSGHGKYTWPDGSTYNGDYLDDHKHGKGTMTFANGDIYTGSFVWGVIAGEGIYKYKSGDIYRGLFYKGQRDGKGMYHFAEHKCQFIGMFEAGVCALLYIQTAEMAQQHHTLVMAVSCRRVQRREMDPV